MSPRTPETVVFAIRTWAPDGLLPSIEVTNEEWLSRGQIRFLYTATNSMMRRIIHGPPTRIVIFVDQRVRHLQADGLINMLTGEDADWDGIVSPTVTWPNVPPEPWYEPICPYAWAARGFVLATLRPAWERHLSFGHERLMADAATKAEIEMVCNLRSTAEIEDEGPASAVTDSLYYLQMQDATTVADVLGVEGPSA